MSFPSGLIQLHFRFSSEGERTEEKRLTNERMDADENDDGAWEGEGWRAAGGGSLITIFAIPRVVVMDEGEGELAPPEPRLSLVLSLEQMNGWHSARHRDATPYSS